SSSAHRSRAGGKAGAARRRRSVRTPGGPPDRRRRSVSDKIPVTVLGATGAVGQKLITLLADHPWFTVASLAASERSAGRRYREVVRWIEPLPLAPLHRAFGVGRVFVTTMQAASGAGYPGVPALDLLGNVIPRVEGEEEKIERETQKILGAAIAISAHTNRVAVVDGHTESISVGLRSPATPEAAARAIATFRGPADLEQLPTTPCPPIVVHQGADRPQPRLDAGLGRGMQVSVGRLRPCPILSLRFTALGHNTVRGTAGAAVLNAELLVARGLIPRR